MIECQHDYENAVRVGRAQYMCPLCNADISFAVILIADAIYELD